MKTSEQRINNIIGQLEGVKKIMANGKSADCLKLLTQLKAIKSATASLMSKVMEEELTHCLGCQEINKSEKIKKLFEEVIKK